MIKSEIFGGTCRAACLVAMAAAGLNAQGTAMTRVSASASDAVFTVDGQAFSGSAAFTWPAGTKHTLEIATWQYAPVRPRARYTFQHWSSAAGLLGSASTIVTITADPAIPWYNANLTLEYVVSLVYFQCDGGACASPGTIWVNQTAYQQDADVWLVAGSTVLLEATPNPGFVFTGWSQGGAPAAIYSLVLNAPTILYPRFAQARSIQIQTSPEELQILADSAPVSGPVTLQWGWATTHTLSAVSPQLDKQGRQWVFRAWSDGGARDHAYQVDPVSVSATIVAEFVRAVPVTLTSVPSGLSLTVDGAPAVTPQTFFWGPGETHSAAAPQHQIDSLGGPWTFREWSSGSSSQQTIPVTDAQVETGVRLTAFYDPQSRIRVDSDPAGLAVSLDGVNCRTPCEVERPVGAIVQVGVLASIGVGDGARLDFASWEGGGGSTIVASAGYHKFKAHYQLSYLLTATMQPAAAGVWRISPPSADGYYPGGSPLSIGVDPVDGMQFDRWGLDLSGSSNPAVMVMDAPHAVEARFKQVPKAAPPPRITNAAGDTPTQAVAAGSIASLFGTALADSTASSSADPLPQSLAGVTLVCSGRLLPLLYVSPEQINFEVPADFQSSTYQLTLHRPNAAVLSVAFDVVRNAPGLLSATHADGTPVRAEAPAHPGEQITLYGTGIGPYQLAPLDGFTIPATPPYLLVDPVAVMVQDRGLEPLLAVAAPGTVGVAMLVIQLPEDLDQTASTAVSLQVLTVKSNALPLPLQ